ncbi:hypothetical protein [Candidatus Vallotia lariciata]|nr:hypothetical protein [Candidatus Vallotia lariciata]
MYITPTLVNELTSVYPYYCTVYLGLEKFIKNSLVFKGDHPG